MTTAITSRKRALPMRWLVGGIVLIALAIAAAIAINNPPGAAPENLGTIVQVARGDIAASIDGSGAVAATKSLEMPFRSTGTVTEVLVEAGDEVEAGQVLARLDDRELQLQLEDARVGLLSAEASLAAAREGSATPQEVASAEASLRNAEAQLLQAQNGSATPADIEAAEAAVRNAEAQLQQIRTGNITAADIASAEASLRAAQARLNQLLAGPDPAALSSAQAQVEQARASLDQLQAPPSGEALIQAETELRNAEAAVQRAQAAYDRVAGRPDVSGTPESLELQQATNNYNAAKARYDELMKGPDPSDLATAQSRLRDAEEQLRIVQQGPSAAEVAEARAGVDQARASLDNLRAGGTAAQIAAAQASVDQARANLEALRQGGTEAAIASAQAGVDQARASLEALTAPASDTDLAIQEASVAQAEHAVAQAQLALENSVLRAPFSGVVTEIDIVPGSIVSANNVALTLMDRSTLHVDLRLSENDVARVQLGQPVTLTIDSLSDWTSEGEVSFIAPAAEVTNDVVTYAVRVRFPDDEPAVKVGMTANLSILTASKENVLIVPASALLPKGAGHVVQVPSGDDTAPREIEVEIGLSDGAMVEIISGLEEGQSVVAVPNDPSLRPPGSPFGN